MACRGVRAPSHAGRAGAASEARRQRLCSARVARRPLRVAAASAEDEDAALEARLAAFKGARSWKQEQAAKSEQKGAAAMSTEAKPSAPAINIGQDTTKPDWGLETVFFDAPPSRGDLLTNIALGATLLWLPLSIAAIGRGLWVRYKVTDKRVSVTSTSPFGAEQLDAAYSQMKEVKAIGRGYGAWGDMVINLVDGSKIEIRSIDRWQEIKAYIEGKIAEAAVVKEADWATKKRN